MLYVILALYAAALAVWGFFRFRKLDSKLRENSRKTRPGTPSDEGEPSWYQSERDDPGWRQQITKDE